MSKHSKHPYLAKVVNVGLGSAGVRPSRGVIWQNREEIREVFSRKLDLRAIFLAFAIYMFEAAADVHPLVLSSCG